MSEFPEQPPEDLLGRPFLAAAGGVPDPLGALEVGPEARHSDIRPYLITGGRTGPGRVAVAMETVVVVSELVRRGHPPGQAFERAEILRHCTRPRSVAEVAAHLGEPLGVAIVLVADLIIDGLLDAADADPGQARDVQLLERLIVGVSGL